MIFDPEADPMRQFLSWYSQARALSGDAADAMILATAQLVSAASREIRPSARVVLYKGVENGGIRFFTNRDSRKGAELSANPFAAAVFHWPACETQVRIEGAVELLSEESSERYWAERPRESQLSALISMQSRQVQDYDSLLEHFSRMKDRMENKAIPRPPNWGGYLLFPDRIEFWKAGENRLHQRLEYRRGPHGWKSRMLAP